MKRVSLDLEDKMYYALKKKTTELGEKLQKTVTMRDIIINALKDKYPELKKF